MDTHSSQCDGCHLTGAAMLLCNLNCDPNRLQGKLHTASRHFLVHRNRIFSLHLRRYRYNPPNKRTNGTQEAVQICYDLCYRFLWCFCNSLLVYSTIWVWCWEVKLAFSHGEPSKEESSSVGCQTFLLHGKYNHDSPLAGTCIEHNWWLRQKWAAHESNTGDNILLRGRSGILQPTFTCDCCHRCDLMHPSCFYIASIVSSKAKTS